MRARPAALALSALVAAAVVCPRDVRAQEEGLAPVEVRPLFAPGQDLPAGWNAFAVRVEAPADRPLKGEVAVETSSFGANEGTSRVSAPFHVAAGATVIVRVPVLVPEFAQTVVRVLADGATLQSTSYSTRSHVESVVLFEVAEPSRLRAAVSDVPVTSSHGNVLSLAVTTPQYDRATGDPVLPDRSPLYANATVVLLKSAELVRLTGRELDALAGYVLGGGTLAVVPSRPEDLRHPTLVSLVGGEVQRAEPGEPLGRPVAPPSVPGAGSARKKLASVASPGEATKKALTGWKGGNLAPSLYGASAYYGLGEVHLLAFDTSQPAIAQDPWVATRMVDLARRSFARRAGVAMRPSAASARTPEVARALDPNETSAGVVLGAALLLCLYALGAGPLNFWLAARKHRPLSAFARLPLFSFAAFVVVVGIGVAVKGVQGRARRLSLLELGAGVEAGPVRRYRGFYVSRASDLTIRTSDPRALAQPVPADTPPGPGERLVVEREGARLVDVAAPPWQTVVIREDGTATLGKGVSIVPEGAGDYRIVNRTGRALRAAMLVLPAGTGRFFDELADGASVLASTGDDGTKEPAFGAWLTSFHAPVFSTTALRGLHAQALEELLEPRSPGLTRAWAALEAAAPGANWFPPGVPVLLAQVDGGEGATTDAGLRVESDRLLLRVVGTGGEP